jgi:ferritin-like metal-binding protein YciE
MPDPNERDAKLIQYLSEAYGKERELEVALQTDIAMTTKAPYKKRLQQHLKETKGHAKALDRRIKKLGGGGQTVQSLVGKATALAKGPLHMVRGDGVQEKMLKNAKTQYTAENEEISTYLAIEVFAGKVGDSETAKLARDIRKEEERMAKFLEGEIRQLAGATALDEVPASQRRSAASKKRSSKAAKKSSAKSSGKKATSRKASTKKSTSKASSKSTKSKPASKSKAAKKSGGAKKPTAKKSAAKAKS